MTNIMGSAAAGTGLAIEGIGASIGLNALNSAIHSGRKKRKKKAKEAEAKA